MKPIGTLTSSLLLVFISLAAMVSHAAQDERRFNQAELEQMLAPIALYPDTVLSHILIAATYPLEVVQAARWSKANRDLSSEAAVAAVESKNWDPSVKALVAFPHIINRMSEDLDWTQDLGEAFLLSEEKVLASIQTLRERAYATGKLDSLEHVKVQRESQVIVIEPAVQQVVFIPYYDTRVVYGDWYWHDYPPIYWHHPHHHHYSGTWVYWSSGVRIPHSFAFSSFHWQRRNVVVIHHYDHRPYYYSSRQIIYHNDARPWRHDPTHRRGVAYRDHRLHNDFARESTERTTLRVVPTSSSREPYEPTHSTRQGQHVTQPRQPAYEPPEQHRTTPMRDSKPPASAGSGSTNRQQRAAPQGPKNSAPVRNPGSGKAPARTPNRTIKAAP